jgi:DeoR family ulaG and ulaABCDEF operon transcriptional repressor
MVCKMLDRERQETVLRLVKQNRFLSIHDAARATGASQATVRRDFRKLEEAGYIHRVRGGVEITEKLKEKDEVFRELPFEYRKGIMLEHKRRIARHAASLCADGETIIIDGGSTTYQMAGYLAPLKLKIVTNSFAIAEHLIKHSESQVYLPGGIIFPESQLILDPFNEDVYKNFFASKVFMGVGGIGPAGATNRDINLIRVERLMIDHAEKLIILADSSKFRSPGDLLLCGFNRIDTIITDSGIDIRSREMVKEHGVELIEI